jgi:hypothetical protein
VKGKSMPSSQSFAHDLRLPPAPHAVHRHRWREVCNGLELFRACGGARCRRSECCRGNPVACLRAGMRLVPESMHEFARSLLYAQDSGLSFEAAFEDALEQHEESYFAWVAGLNAKRQA